MSVRREVITVTTNTWGGGTAVSPAPISGEILEVRKPGTDLDSAGSADFKLTRGTDGGTVLNLTNASGPWQYAPRQVAHEVDGDSLTYAAGSAIAEYIPCDDYLTAAFVSAGSAESGTVFVYYRP